MQVNKITSSILKNKTVLKSLEKISDHGTSFTAGISLLLSLGLRPLSIKSTPNVEKENKHYAIANSISSGLIKFGIVEAFAIPIENAVKNIDKNKLKFLNNETLQNLTPRNYNLLTQIIKLSVGFLTAIPKSMITIALIPIVMDKLFKQKTENNHNSETIKRYSFEGFRQKSESSYPTFTGKTNNFLSKQIAKIINNSKIQKFVIKNESKDKNIPKHIVAGTDVLLTSAFVVNTNKSKDIKENRKKALIYNNIISTLVTLFGGYGLDKLLKGKTKTLEIKLKKLNPKNPNIDKCIEGLNILRPALIFGGIYYVVLPIFSTYMAERIDKFVNKNN